MKSFVAIVALFVTVCSAEQQHSRGKRDYGSNTCNAGPPNYPYGYDPNNGDYQAPHCKPPPSCIDPSQLPGQSSAEAAAGVGPRIYYLTATTCWGAVQFTTAFLGRPPRTNRELNEMCANEFFGNLGISYNSAYGRQIVQRCPVNSAVCTTAGVEGESDDNTNPRLLPPEDDYIIAGENGIYVLFYRCVNKKYADFQLFTTRPYVDRYISNSVIDTMLQLGFSQDQIILPQCQPPTYYPPYQNYPIPAVDPSLGACAQSYQGSSPYTAPASPSYDIPAPPPYVTPAPPPYVTPVPPSYDIPAPPPYSPSPPFYSPVYEPAPAPYSPPVYSPPSPPIYEPSPPPYSPPASYPHSPTTHYHPTVEY